MQSFPTRFAPERPVAGHLADLLCSSQMWAKCPAQRQRIGTPTRKERYAIHFSSQTPPRILTGTKVAADTRPLSERLHFFLYLAFIVGFMSSSALCTMSFGLVLELENYSGAVSYLPFH